MRAWRPRHGPWSRWPAAKVRSLLAGMLQRAAAVLTAPGASLRVRVSVIIVLFAVLAILAIGPPAQEPGVS